MTTFSIQPTDVKGSLVLGKWQAATWPDYLRYRNTLGPEQFRLFFYEHQLLITYMCWEGINHATICDLFTLIFGFWFSAFPDQIASSLGRCLLEKEQVASGAPDLVLYLGDNYPQWQPGDPRRIDLNQWRVPDLVGEISDTTLAIDLDEKKQLYAALGIPEYWVVDVRGQRVFAFLLKPNGKYQACEQSQALAGLAITILEQTLMRLHTESNIQAAQWFSQNLAINE
jgi:Uma2 family endonuclease